MLDKLFLEVLNMSYVGSIVILAIVIVRIFLKKVPRKFSYILWIVPLLRLLLPFSIESVFSLVPINPKPIPADIGYSLSPRIETGVNNIDYSMNRILPSPELVTSINPLQIILAILGVMWLIGTVGMIIYGCYTYYKLRKRLTDAVLSEKGDYWSSKVETPFVMGIIKPRIYLPDTVSESERKYILLHERTHIKRFDHVFRGIAYLALCIHWFNPMVWIAFHLSGNDMEMSCDEAVIHQLGGKGKKEYSQLLLNFTTNKNRLRMTPLAFGEGNTKGRIKHILGFQKPRTYVVIVMAIVLIIISVGLLMNPEIKEDEPAINGHTYEVVDILYTSPAYSYTYTMDKAPAFTISSDYGFYSKEDDKEWKAIGSLYKPNIKSEELMDSILFKEFLDERTSRLIEDAKIVYKVDTNDNNSISYLVVETKENHLLIFYGYDVDNEMHTRWIFEVEANESLEPFIALADLWNYRTEYVGDNSSVATISGYLEYPDNMDYDGIALQTKSQPYGLTVNLQVHESSKEGMSQERADLLFEKNACILFSLVQNLDEVTFSLESNTGNPQPYVYTRDWAENLVGVALWDGSSNPSTFEELLVKIEDSLDQ